MGQNRRRRLTAAAIAAGVLSLVVTGISLAGEVQSQTGKVGVVSWSSGPTLVDPTDSFIADEAMSFPKLSITRSSAYAGAQKITITEEIDYTGINSASQDFWYSTPLATWTGSATAASGQYVSVAARNFSLAKAAPLMISFFNESFRVSWSNANTGAVLGTLAWDFNSAGDYHCSNPSLGCGTAIVNGFAGVVGGFAGL